MNEKTYDHWTDVTGREFRPGDIVAIATINGRSPQMVLAKVERINRVNSRNEEVVSYEFAWEDGGENTAHWMPGRGKGTRVSKASCTVTALPIQDARDFYRSNRGGKQKLVTYQIPENILLVKSKAEL